MCNYIFMHINDVTGLYTQHRYIKDISANIFLYTLLRRIGNSWPFTFNIVLLSLERRWGHSKIKINLSYDLAKMTLNVLKFEVNYF